MLSEKSIAEALLSRDLAPNGLLRRRISEGTICDSSSSGRGAASELHQFFALSQGEGMWIAKSWNGFELIQKRIPDALKITLAGQRANECASSARVGRLRADPLHGRCRVGRKLLAEDIVGAK